ncbi:MULTISPECIES: hypothetical protein [unclassified Streptomyces]|uniref:hypothetical protein n=1 Tax=unclassified Streptomyces TaxID=2593676 RepID=UPI0034181AF0
MTGCVKGGHDFPYEDETGAYCHEHGVTLLWRGDPIAGSGLPGGCSPGAGSVTGDPDDPGGPDGVGGW